MTKIVENTDIEKHLAFLQPYFNQYPYLKGFESVFQKYSLFQVREGFRGWITHIAGHTDKGLKIDFPLYDLLGIMRLLDALIGTAEGWTFYADHLNFIASDLKSWYDTEQQWLKLFDKVERFLCTLDEGNNQALFVDLRIAVFKAVAIENNFDLQKYES